MPKTWQQPYWRNYAMQAAMWVVFAGTLCGAAWVGHYKRQANVIRLGPEQIMGSVSVRIPADWEIDPSSTESALVAHPPGTQAADDENTPTRELTISTMSAQVARLRRMWMGSDREDLGPGVTPIDVGPAKGQLIVQVMRTMQGNYLAVMARATLPDGSMVALQLDDPTGEAADEDVRLIKAVAGSVRVEKQTAGSR